jgi:hypothetical protein
VTQVRSSRCRGSQSTCVSGTVITTLQGEDASGMTTTAAPRESARKRAAQEYAVQLPCLNPGPSTR